LFFCRIHNYNIYYCPLAEETYPDEVFFCIKSDAGGSLLLKLDFIIQFETAFVVLYSVVKKNCRYDQELFDYVIMQLLIELQHHARQFDSRIEFTLFESVFEGVIPNKENIAA
jgi:hypothetical protein